MSEDDKKAFQEELKKSTESPDLIQTETKETRSEIVLKLKCKKCSEIFEFPLHCDEQMDLDGTTLTCETCGHTQEVDKHCDEPLKPFISKK